MVFPAWDLFRDDFPLRRGGFHLIERLLRKGFHYTSCRGRQWDTRIMPDRLDSR